jgi:peptidoglycan hydrolase-like protein with peptidoglycan-binding domain
MRPKIWEVGVRTLFLSTVCAAALGLGTGLAFAAGNMPGNPATAGGSNMPAAAGTSQPGTNTGTNTGSSMPSSAMPGMTGTSQWGTGGQTGWRGEVMQIQQKLQADNLYSGKIDGRLGPETRQALRSYQKQNNLRVTARLDRETRDSILGNGGTGRGSSMTPATGNMPKTPQVPAK